MKVLIVEIDLPVANLLVSMLEKNFPGSTCVKVRDGDTALEQLTYPGDGNKFDLAIIDAETRIDEGIHLIRQIRENGIQIPVILVDPIRAMGDIGKVVILAKPFGAEVLSNAVRMVKR